ncbi:GATA transcription factor 23-like isoform X2 [Dioscorea cayenensis subsp. rotundata]|uniref:GATA transcription factor 23-like isoform X2 n=1 Tax=Dioscorea cayennensis subsp. rotundata TaxID=55577 RepID=A0AB40B6E3_DIOCR|nr:GATA transcription factor 23-like isoform X2 [Dioscorea cayenensis subsp. rotundata]
MQTKIYISLCNNSEDAEQVEQLMISESSIQHGHDHEHTKWMSSKMRLMKKMMNSNQSTSTSKPRRNNSVPESGDVIRVCSDCRTTKTPLWRSGPQGPKSLCNACGIRQRKARKLQSMAMSSDRGHTVPFKKRFKITTTENSAFHPRLLPQDEKEAAILLMALSCGLLHS